MSQAWPWPILPQGQIGLYMCLNGENFYKVINCFKYATNGQNDQNFVHIGLSAPALGLYTHEKH